jgi:hypothetical protein
LGNVVLAQQYFNKHNSNEKDEASVYYAAKAYLDNQQLHLGISILMDLSKAFDCLPHDILICKFSAYGLSDNATKLLLSYLVNRKQQIKIVININTQEFNYLIT